MDSNVLLVTAAEEIAAAWAEHLSQCRVQSWRPGTPPPSVRADVVVIVGDLSPPIGAAAPDAQRADDLVGVIRIGGTQPADVTLPADATGRELRLACQLLGEVVRLRRQAHEESQAQRRLFHQALTDPLTGLPNRRAWDQTFAARLATPQPPKRLCVAILDVDHFKQINDRHGHLVGDAVLRHAAAALRDSLRQNDFVARLGGDEFGLLLWVTDPHWAPIVVERVRRALSTPCPGAHAPPITASAGYCITPAGDQSPSPEQLLAEADAALRAAKQQGRNRTVGSTP